MRIDQEFCMKWPFRNSSNIIQNKSELFLAKKKLTSDCEKKFSWQNETNLDSLKSYVLHIVPLFSMNRRDPAIQRQWIRWLDRLLTGIVMENLYSNQFGSSLCSKLLYPVFHLQYLHLYSFIMILCSPSWDICVPREILWSGVRFLADNDKPPFFDEAERARCANEWIIAISMHPSILWVKDARQFSRTAKIDDSHCRSPGYVVWHSTHSINLSLRLFHGTLSLTKFNGF
jgi:hypothetical protein